MTATQQRFIQDWLQIMGRGEVDLNALNCFYLIAGSQEPLQQSVIVDMTGLSEASVTRNLQLLGQGSTARVPGPRLIEQFKDPTNARRNLVRLTAKGKRFLKTLTERMG